MLFTPISHLAFSAFLAFSAYIIPIALALQVANIRDLRISFLGKKSINIFLSWANTLAKSRSCSLWSKSMANLPQAAARGSHTAHWTRIWFGHSLSLYTIGIRSLVLSILPDRYIWKWVCFNKGKSLLISFIWASTIFLYSISHGKKALTIPHQPITILFHSIIR